MKQKKRLKGLTLIEIVVSMAIYGVLALLLVEIMTCVNHTITATTQLNKRLAYEAKYADNRQTTVDADGSLDHDTCVLPISYVDNVAGAVSANLATSHTADQYTVHYISQSDITDFSVNTNYKYVVYNTAGAGDSILDYFNNHQTFNVILQQNSSFSCPYPIKSVEVQGDGIATADHKQVFSNFPNKLTIPVRRAVPDVDAEGRLSASNTADNTGTLKITIYADMSSATDNRNEQVEYNGSGVKYPSNNFPYMTLNLKYCMWITDKNVADPKVHLSGIYDSATFNLSADGKVWSADQSRRGT